MKLKTILLIFILIVLSCSKYETAKTQTIFENYLSRAEKFGFSGTVFFRKGDTILLNEGKGFSSLNLNNDSETLFYIASISKSFTAAAIIKLEEQNKLKVTDSIYKFFKNCPSDKKKITIHQLLSHTSGIKSFGWNNKTNDWKIMSKQEAIEGILDSKLHSSKNKFNYNNANYILLAAIIEMTSRKTYQDYIRDEFLIPMKMQKTFFGYTIKKNNSMKIAQHFINEQGSKSYLDYPKSWLRIGGGDILSTASDLDKWISSLYNGNILSEKSKSKLFTIQTKISDNFGYGYGWYIREFPEIQKKIIFHTGSFKGYSSELRYYPKSDKSIAIFSNDGTISNITEVISNDIISLAKYDSIRIPKIKSIDYKLKSFKGKYTIDSTSYFMITTVSDKIVTAKAYGQKALLIQNGNIGHYEEMLLLNSLTYNLLATLTKNQENAFENVLPNDDLIYLKEYIDEWNAFTELDEYSYKIHHTNYLGNSIYRTYISINTSKGTKYFGFTWKNQKLIGTAPNERFNIPSIKLLPNTQNELIYYDWNKRESQFWRFLKKGTDSTFLEIKLKSYIINGFKE